MKYLLIIFFLPLFCKGQYIPDEVDYFQPYLLDNGRIIGANTALLNPDSAQTGIDTIFYRLMVSFPNNLSPVHIRVPSDPALVYEMVLAMNAYAIWQRDPIVGNHWHIYDELRRPIEFLIRRGAVIWKIIETGQK